MESGIAEEVFRVSIDKDIAETGGGHNQKGVDFQRAWAISRMFEMEDAGEEDFLFLFEAIQDVAILNSSSAPSTIRVFQVKKKDRGEWEWSHLTNLPAPGKKKRKNATPKGIEDSPLGKLYASVLAFKRLRSSGSFLSNAGCNLPLEGGRNAATSVSCDLSKLDAAHLELLKGGLETLHKIGSPAFDPASIAIEKVDMPPGAPMTHLHGIALGFLEKRSPPHAGQAKAFTDALMAEVGPLGAKTDSCSSFDELLQQKGYSRTEFRNALGKLEMLPDFKSIAEGWLDAMVSEGGIDFMERTSAEIALGNIYRRQVMGGASPMEEALIDDCDRWLDSNKPGTRLTDFFDKARSHLAPSHPFFKGAELTAHIALRAVRKCVAPT